MAQLYDALQQEPPDGGLCKGLKVAAYVRDRWGVEAAPDRLALAEAARLSAGGPPAPPSQGRHGRTTAEVALTAWNLS